VTLEWKWDEKGRKGWIGLDGDYPLPTGSENLGEGRLHKTGPACVVLPSLQSRARLAAGQAAISNLSLAKRYSLRRTGPGHHFATQKASHL
jgi:hypothetical protein